jgi:hypothetical protein
MYDFASDVRLKGDDNDFDSLGNTRSMRPFETEQSLRGSPLAQLLVCVFTRTVRSPTRLLYGPC